MQFYNNYVLLFHNKDLLYVNMSLRYHVYSHRHHRLPQLCVLADNSCVDVLAEGRSVVIDISQVDVHSGHVTERW